jgi:hypothetical protein
VDHKSVLPAFAAESDSKNVDRSIGFEGTPDPPSGYYCFYDGGRLVKSDSQRGASKKLRRMS